MLPFVLSSMQSYSMKCLCKAISSCSVKINTLTPGSPRDPAEPVSFDLFFFGRLYKAVRFHLEDGSCRLPQWRFLWFGRVWASVLGEWTEEAGQGQICGKEDRSCGLRTWQETVALLFKVWYLLHVQCAFFNLANSLCISIWWYYRDRGHTRVLLPPGSGLCWCLKSYWRPKDLFADEIWESYRETGAAHSGLVFALGRSCDLGCGCVVLLVFFLIIMLWKS